MSLIDFMKKRSIKRDELYEEIFELESELSGAEIEYQGKEAIIMEVDWEEKAVLLNYDDVNMEWISFED